MGDTSERLDYLAGLLRGLTAFSNTLAEDDGKGFVERFAGFKEVGREGTSKAAKDPQNKAKNRYKNVLSMHILPMVHLLLSTGSLTSHMVQSDSWLPDCHGDMMCGQYTVA